MTTLAFFGEPRMPRLSRLLQEMKRGEILVPRFQRPFVWTDEQRLNLLESVYSGYPIGAILVWRTQKHRLLTYGHLGPLHLPPDTGEEGTRQYLLDGHQRMATLFAALGPGLYDREGEDRPSWSPEDAEERASWPIYFDLEAEKQPFRLPRRRQVPPPTWLPLDRLFDSYALREIEEALRNAGHDRKLVNRVQSVAEVFRDYVIPVMPMATEDMKQATTSFKRVNSGGTPMSEVHMVNALVHSQFDLMRELDALALELKPVGWYGFDRQMILNICKARLGLSLYDEDAETIAEELQKKPEVLGSVRDDVVKAAGVLDKIAGVRGPASLPYSYQAVLLADALEDVDTPSDELLEKLKLWFWSTTLTEYFRGMSSSLFERARQHLHALVAGKMSWLPPDVPSVVDAVRRFDFRSARSRAVGLLLAELRPVDPDGRADDAFELLAQFGVDALSKLVPEREVPVVSREQVDGPENRFLVFPRQTRRLQMLLEGPGLFFDARAFASHAIDDAALEALRQKRWGNFLHLRRLTIEGLERARVEQCGLDYRAGAD